jgi:predicted transcriptional regulator
LPNSGVFLCILVKFLRSIEQVHCSGLMNSVDRCWSREMIRPDVCNVAPGFLMDAGVLERGWSSIMNEVDKSSLVALTASIVSAYVSKNAVGREDLPAMIADVHEALSRASQRVAIPEREELKPAVSPKKSIHDDYIICLEDGKKFKSLKRHLRTHYNLSPEEYREKWGLAHDYPMVAPKYAAARSQLAKQMGLGRKEK